MDPSAAPRTPQWTEAIAAWRSALGNGHVLEGGDLAPYLANVSGLEAAVPCVLRPSDTEQVQQAVRIAAEYAAPVYPLSRGCNWGLGSRLPARKDCAILDLSRMNRIREVNVEGAYAVIEPGVTQEQLYRYIAERNLPLLLNVTGSSRDSSLLGNALERGIGYFATRADSLCGLEVVLGRGELVRTGFSHIEGASTAHLYRHGIGPGLDGLFFQSNMGIVTAAGFALIPKPEAQTSMLAKLRRAEDFVAFIDALAKLRRDGVLTGVIHIGNRARTEIAIGPLVYNELKALGYPAEGLAERCAEVLAREGFGPWSAITGIMGTRPQVAVCCREVRKALSSLAEVRFMTPEKLERVGRVLGAFSRFEAVRLKLAVLRAVSPLQGLSAGIPTDAALHSVCWPVEQTTRDLPYNPDQTRGGMLYCLPFCGLSGRDGAALMSIAEETCGKHGFVPYVTLNTLDSKVMEAVINIAFDREDVAAVRRAHACNDEMHERFIAAGFPPYRVGVQSMGLIVDPGNPFWQVARTVKIALDPYQIIAPGRYSLL